MSRDHGHLPPILPSDCHMDPIDHWSKDCCLWNIWCNVYIYFKIIIDPIQNSIQNLNFVRAYGALSIEMYQTKKWILGMWIQLGCKAKILPGFHVWVGLDDWFTMASSGKLHFLPYLWKSKMGPSNNSYLSNNDFGRKSNLIKKIHSLKLTIRTWKLDGWKTMLSFWDGIFSGANY